MIELCYFSLDQWEIRIHLLWGKSFKIPHHCDPHLNQTKWLIFNDLLPLTIPGVLAHLLMLGEMYKQVKFGSHSMPRQRKLIRQKETGTLSSSCLPPGAKLTSFRVMTSLISFSKSLIGLPIDRRPKCLSVPGSEHRWPLKILPSPPTSWPPPTPGYPLSLSSASK